MLQTFLEYYDIHPQEDLQTISLMVVGILKAVAVLKQVRMIMLSKSMVCNRIRYSIELLIATAEKTTHACYTSHGN